MGRGDGPGRGRPLGESGPPFRGPPDWGPPPPGGWGPPPPGGWGPPPEEWGPPPHGGWGSRGPPHWDHRGPPHPYWDMPALPPPDWDPRGPPPPDWDPRAPPPPDWDPRGPPPPRDWYSREPLPPGWGAHPEDWIPPPEWDRLDWRHPEWGRHGPPGPWGPEPVPPVPPIPPVQSVPPGAVPPVVPPVVPPPPGIPPHPANPVACPPVMPPGFGFPPFPPTSGWTGEAVAEEPMLNPPPEQPEWIKALISAPPADVTPTEPKASTEVPAVTKVPDPVPPLSPALEPTPKPKVEGKTAKFLGLLGKRTFDKPPPGRSSGIISFIGPTFGHIEREDLKTFTFKFDVFFGNPKAMTPGVRVHFTACEEKLNRCVATDVKVAPGGTENVDMEIYEAVVSQPILEPQPGERQYPGQVYVTIGPVRTNLPFERKDSTVSLLKNDQVLINLLTDIVTEKRRATNIKPKIPATFSHTNEIREKGVIFSLKDTTGIIKSDEHGDLPFETGENLSDIEFTEEDISEEVEFTVIQLKVGKRAIRIKRSKEPLLLTLCAPEDVDKSAYKIQKKASRQIDIGPNMVLDSELYEGIVSQPIIEPKPNMPGYPGQIHANIGPIKTNVTFDHKDCGVTLLKNDHVLINLLLDTVTKRRRAANIRPKIPFTFSYTKETRELGTIVSLSADEGVIKSDQHGELPFDLNENFSDTEFTADDVHQEVEFTVSQKNEAKRAIRLRRMKKNQDKILLEQKKRDEEEKKKEAEERKRREAEELEAEKKKKEEAAAALAAAKNKWTPFGFKFQIPNSMDEISKERFDGTILKAISRIPIKEMKTDPEETRQIKIKVDKGDEQQEEAAEAEEMKNVKKEEGDDGPVKNEAPETGIQADAEMGRLVMTIDGEQKQLPFRQRDLLSTATMLVGDKVRFNIATHRETKEERATFVEILHDSFEESTEQRHFGLVIEFSDGSGLIKCSQNPQLFFAMSEVIEKKKLELNEKVEFSIVPHDSAEGGIQAIRIKRFTEKMFLPARKLCAVGANKGKMTIKLTPPSKENEKTKPEAEKLKTVVKNLRKDYNTTRIKYSRSRSRSASRSRAKSRSPPKDQYGRVIQRRRSPSIERRAKRYRSRESHRRSRSKSRSRSRSKSRSRSRSKSRSRSQERSTKRRSKNSRDREESRRGRREPSPPRKGGVVDSELARKKRELEELNEMIAYKKALVEIDPRGLEPGQRTCIDYDHGRISTPRSILKKRPAEPEYLLHPPYDDPYYDRLYDPYHSRRYSNPYSDPYGRDVYTEGPYESRLYSEPPLAGPASTSRRYTDRYEVYDEPYDDHYYDRQHDLHPPHKRSRSPVPYRSSPPPQSQQVSSVSSKPQPSFQHAFRPPSPIDSPPRSPSPKPKVLTPQQCPPAEKPPLDRFLDMLSKKVDAKKKPEPDDLLPHERALQDGGGFSRIVGLAQEPTGISLPLEEKGDQPSLKRSSEERTTEKQKVEPYDKIQSLLRSIGLKLSSGDVSTLASRAQEKNYSFKSSSTEREAVSVKEEPSGNSSSAAELTSSVRSSSMEPLSRQKTSVSEYEDFLDQQELATLKKVQQLQSLTKTAVNSPTSTPSPKPPPGPPPANYKHPPVPLNWPLSMTPQVSQTSSCSSTDISGSTEAAQPRQKLGLPPGPPPGHPPRRPLQPPPGPPPGPPPRRPLGQPLFAPPSTRSALPFIEQSNEASAPSSSSHLLTTAETSSVQSMSTTVARCLKVIETVKSLSTQPATKPAKSVQFSLPTGMGANPLSSADTEDNLRSKHVEKLDPHCQRAEQQFKKHGDHIADGPISADTDAGRTKLL
ncbi:uncharacterized protein si:dkeyp-121d4.3 isoform X2 [Oryzias latipes]